MMKWLLIGVLLLAQYPLMPLRVTGPGSAPPPPTDHPLLTEDNLTYIGGFLFPTTVNNGSTNVATSGSLGALAVRIVAGQPQFFSTLNDGKDSVYEVDYPGSISTNFANWLTGTAHYVGDIYQGKRCNSEGVSGGFDCTNAQNSTYGLYWDETDQRLYWTYGDQYGNDADSAAIGYSTLSGFVGTAAGAWKMASPVDGKAVRGGMLAIPSWFQALDPSLVGKRLGSGFGGYYSIGQHSSEGVTLVAWDPALTATTLPATHTQAGGHMANTPLALFGGSGATPFTNPPLGIRDTLYESSAWLPHWWQQFDTMKGGAWIDMPATGVGHPGVSGVLTFSAMLHGGTGYFQAQLRSDHTATVAYITDPAILLQVAQGSLPTGSANPTTIMYPTIRVGMGAAFDATTNRLYILNANTPPTVQVYQVADTVTPAAPTFYGTPGNVSIASTSTANTATFTVGVEGKPRPTIQWQTSPTGSVWTNFTGNADGINKPIVDDAILYFTPTSLSQNGLKIRAIATNASGSTTSASGTLTITGSTPYVAAAFSVDPQSHSIQANHAGSLSTTTTGNPAPNNYIWWYSLDSGVTWTDWNQAGAGDGTHTNTLTFAVNQLPLSYDQSQWRVCIWQPGFWVRNVIRSAAGSAGSKCSGIATLTITP